MTMSKQCPNSIGNGMAPNVIFRFQNASAIKLFGLRPESKAWECLSETGVYEPVWG